MCQEVSAENDGNGLSLVYLTIRLPQRNATDTTRRTILLCSYAKFWSGMVSLFLFFFIYIFLLHLYNGRYFVVVVVFCLPCNLTRFLVFYY